jgi:DNA polymerase bacteriophage-type
MTDVIERYLTHVAHYAEAAGLPTKILRDLDRAADRAIRDSGSLYRLHHDFETFNERSLPDVGADVYSRDPSCEVLMCAYSVNDNDIHQWVPAEGEKMPAELREMMLDKRAIKFAWNKPFEWSIWANCLGIETAHEEWRDPMIMSFSLSLPGSLSMSGQVVELPEDTQKMKDGKLLIREFCVPRKPTKNKPYTRTLPHHEPEKWERFKLYNRTDVGAERGILRKLKPFDMSPFEWRLWILDQKINQAGIPINMDLVRNAITVYEGIIDTRIKRMKAITGLANPNSNSQLLGWLKERGHLGEDEARGQFYPFDDVTKGHVQRAKERLDSLIDLDDFADPGEKQEAIDVREVLETRLVVAATSPKKYYALERAVDQSGPVPVLRNAFQFAGAGRTGRWAGRLFQAQNLPRPAKLLEKKIAAHVRNLELLTTRELEALYPKPMDLLKSCIRPAAQAPEGYLFVDADLNAIENRVLGWIAECVKILRVFHLNRDPYIDFATYLFGGFYDDLMAEYKAGDSYKRTISKPGVLGCGYMLGPGAATYNKKTGEVEATGLLGYAWNMGIRDFTEEQAKASVETFRREFEEVKNFWYAIERAAVACVTTGNTTRCSFVEFELDGPFLRMILPSGRPLSYCRPAIEEVRTPWGAMKNSLTYEGQNDRNQWVRISTHGGKLTENAVQAIARDLLAHGMMLADERGVDIRIHVHDQIVGLSPISKADRDLEILQECMGVVPTWTPGLPLGSAGFVSPIFIKD